MFTNCCPLRELVRLTVCLRHRLIIQTFYLFCSAGRNIFCSESTWLCVHDNTWLHYNLKKVLIVSFDSFVRKALCSETNAWSISRLKPLKRVFLYRSFVRGVFCSASNLLLCVYDITRLQLLNRLHCKVLCSERNRWLVSLRTSKEPHLFGLVCPQSALKWEVSLSVCLHHLTATFEMSYWYILHVRSQSAVQWGESFIVCLRHHSATTSKRLFFFFFNCSFLSRSTQRW